MSIHRPFAICALGSLWIAALLGAGCAPEPVAPATATPAADAAPGAEAGGAQRGASISPLPEQLCEPDGACAEDDACPADRACLLGCCLPTASRAGVTDLPTAQTLYDYGPSIAERSEPSGDGWTAAGRFEFEYGAGGRLSRRTARAGGGSLGPAQDTTYAYTPEGRLLAERSSGELLGASLSRTDKVYAYDVDGRVLGWFEASRGLRSWDDWERVSCFYGDGGRLTAMLHESRGGKGSWEPTRRATFRYDADGRYHGELGEEFKPERGWVTLERHVCEYDADGRWTTDRIERLDPVDQTWQADEELSLQYGDGGVAEGILRKRVDGEWVPVSRQVGEYEDGRARTLTRYEADGDAWTPVERIEASFTDQGSSFTFEVDPHPIRRWALESFGGERLIRDVP